MIYLLTKQTSLFDFTDIQSTSFEIVYSYIENSEIVYLDLETEGFDPYTKRVLTLQVGDKDNQYIVDTGSYSLSMFPNLANKTIVGHNLAFDLRFLNRAGIFPTKVFDTYIVERILYRGLIKPLGFYRLDSVVERHTGHADIDKSIRGHIHFQGLSDSVLKYAAKDVEYLSELRFSQIEMLKEQDLEDYAALENLFTPVIGYNQYCGFKLDPEKWLEKINLDIKERDTKLEELNQFIINFGLEKYIDRQGDLFNENAVRVIINWNSSHQVKKLFKELKIPIEITQKGQTKESIEIKHIQSQKHPIIKPYIAYSKAQKEVSSFGYNILNQLNPVSKRLHTTNQQIIDTGRISSGGKDKTTGMEGLNMQNIPGKSFTRACFVAENGCSLGIADYSSQESVVLANQSEEPAMLEFFRGSIGDMHSYVASLMYEIPVINIIAAKEKKEEGMALTNVEKDYIAKRSLAKNAGFAINYGGTGYTISVNTNLPKEQGEIVYNSYFKAFPHLGEYFEKIKSNAVKGPYVQINDIFRAKTYLTDIYEEYKLLESQLDRAFWDNYKTDKSQKSKVSRFFSLKGMLERSHLNYKVQGTSGEMTKLAGVYFYRWVIDNHYQNIVKICNFVHDEIVIEAPDNLIEEATNKLSECMFKASEIFCKHIPIKAQGIISKFWRK